VPRAGQELAAEVEILLAQHDARADQRMAERRSVVYCIVPEGLAAELHGPLREFFAAHRGVEVVVEQRGGERRRVTERRGMRKPLPGEGERRRQQIVVDAGGRRPPGKTGQRDADGWRDHDPGDTRRERGGGTVGDC